MALAGLAVYANSLPNGFALDDLPLVRDNPSIPSLGKLPQHLLEPYWGPGGAAAGLYRPVTVLSLTVNRALGGPGPLGFHAGNLFLHVSVCLLVWLVADSLAVRRFRAIVVALLFAVHPLHTEAVANVAGRAELLGALGVLAAWYAHRRAATAQERWKARGWTAAAAAGLLFAVGSKENTILAPLLFLVDDRTSRTPPRAIRRGAYAVYAGVLAVSLALRSVVLGGFHGARDVAFLDNPAAFAALPVRLATACWVQARYLGLFVWPAGLSSDYSFDAVPVVAGVGDPRLWVGLAVVAGLGGTILLAWKRSRVALLAAAIWLVFIVPGSGFLFPAGTIMAERLTYLASFGGCLAVGGLLGRGLSAGSGRVRVAAWIGTTLIAAGLAGRTVVRNPAWHDNASLALTDVRTEPRSAKLQAGAGIVLHERGEFAAAAEAYRRALEIYPGYAQVHYNLGELLAARGEVDEAIEHLARATRLSPDNPRPYKRLALLLEQSGRTAEALDAYAAGARLDPADLPLRFNLGRLLVSLGREEQALDTLRALARDAPGSVPGRLAAALAARTSGDPEEAARIYRELLQRDDLPPDVRRRIQFQLR